MGSRAGRRQVLATVSWKQGGAAGPDAPVSRAHVGVEVSGSSGGPGWSQTAPACVGRWAPPPTHLRGLCVLVALSYTFAWVITSRAGRLKLPRVILGRATITTSFCCGDVTFDCLIAAGFVSGPAAKAVSLA